MRALSVGLTKLGVLYYKSLGGQGESFGAILKYEVGVVPSDFLNIEIKALGVLYPASRAACVTFAPSANSRRACISLSCCLHFPNVIPTSSWKSLSIVLLLAPLFLQI